jgi:Co/Zn/Cd efflux system component
VLAVVGLSAGYALGWVWMDPAMGIVGALVIANWSWGLLRAAGGVLVDMRPEGGLAEEIRHRLEAVATESPIFISGASGPATMPQ